MAQASQFIVESKNTVNVPIASEQDRITKFAYRNNMLNDNFYHQVELELGNVYSKSKELGLLTQIDDTNNLFRMVIEEISRVYDNGLYRTFDENEAIQEDMEMLYSELEIDDVMAQANIHLNAFNDVLIQIGVKDDIFTLKLRRPDNTIVKYSDDNGLEEVYIYIGEDDESNQIWYGYTKTEMFKVIVSRADDVLNDDKIKYSIDDDSNDITNNLGFLPFVPIHNGYRDSEFWQMHKGDDLIKGTIQVAIKLTFLSHLIKMQSFKQLVASGSNLQQLNGTVLDPQTILFIEGEDTDIKTIDLESNYKALWETIQSINQNIAMNYKISPNLFRMTGNVSSGFALKMENIKLDKFIKKQQSIFAKTEKRLFNLMKDIDEVLGLGLIKSEKISISFEDIQYPMSQEELLSIQEREIEIGLHNQIDIIKDRDGVDYEEASEIYNTNLEVRNKAYQKLDGGSTLDFTSTANELGL